MMLQSIANSLQLSQFINHYDFSLFWILNISGKGWLDQNVNVVKLTLFSCSLLSLLLPKAIRLVFVVVSFFCSVIIWSLKTGNALCFLLAQYQHQEKFNFTLLHVNDCWGFRCLFSLTWLFHFSLIGPVQLHIHLFFN